MTRIVQLLEQIVNFYENSDPAPLVALLKVILDEKGLEVYQDEQKRVVRKKNGIILDLIELSYLLSEGNKVSLVEIAINDILRALENFK